MSSPQPGSSAPTVWERLSLDLIQQILKELQEMNEMMRVMLTPEQNAKLARGNDKGPTGNR